MGMMPAHGARFPALSAVGQSSGSLAATMWQTYADSIPRSAADRAGEMVHIGDYCRGDGSDESDGILRAVSKLSAANGGTVFVDRPVYFASGLTFDRTVVFRGLGASRFNNTFHPPGRLVYMGAGSWGMDFAGPTACRASGFENINVEYNNASFTGNLVQNHCLGFHAKNTTFIGLNDSLVPVYGANALVALGRAHSYYFQEAFFDYAQRGIYLYDDGSHATPNTLRLECCHLDNLVMAGVDMDPALTPILNTCIDKCGFNPISLSRTNAQGSPRVGLYLRCNGVKITGSSFAGTSLSAQAWSDCAIKWDGSRGEISGNKFGTSGCAVRVLGGTVGINNNYFDAGLPYWHEGGNVSLRGNVYAYQSYTWTALTPTKKYDLVIPATPNGFCYRALNDGITGASQPTFPTSIASTVVDGSVTWYAQQIAVILGITVDGAGTPHIDAVGEDYPGGYAYTYLSSGQTANNGRIEPATDGTTNGIVGNGGVEVRCSNPRSVAKTASYTITNRDGGNTRTWTNKGAAGSITFTLPDEANNKTLFEHEFINFAGQPIVVQRGGSTNVILGPAGAVNSLTSAGTVGERLLVKYDNQYSTTGAWVVKSIQGTWT